MLFRSPLPIPRVLFVSQVCQLAIVMTPAAAPPTIPLSPPHTPSALCDRILYEILSEADKTFLTFMATNKLGNGAAATNQQEDTST